MPDAYWTSMPLTSRHRNLSREVARSSPHVVLLRFSVHEPAGVEPAPLLFLSWLALLEIRASFAAFCADGPGVVEPVR
jgi:hypothetical protein